MLPTGVSKTGIAVDAMPLARVRTSDTTIRSLPTPYKRHHRLYATSQFDSPIDFALSL